MTIKPFHLRIKFDQYRFCYIFYIFDRKIELDFKNVFLVGVNEESFITKKDIDKALRNILNKNLVDRRLFK